MKTEIIMAVRGELPENLKRTVEAAVEAASVCVVYDGQENPQPGSKLKKIMATDKIRIEVPWQVPRGPGQARHFGITTSKADIVILTDGHMTFPDKWVAEIENYFADNRHAKHLTCCRMQSLDQRFNPMEKKIEGGAFLAVMTEEVCGEYWAISAKWIKPARESGYINVVMGKAGNCYAVPYPARESGYVNAAMGACYAMRRDWYGVIGQPLKILEAWGGDEEILSIATHIMGGKIRLLPIICGHIYMAAHEGRINTADEDDRRWSNRFAIVDVLPAPKKEKEELRAWLRRTKRIANDLSHCFPAGRLEAMKELADVLRRGKYTWADMINRNIARRLTDEEQVKCLGHTVRRDDEKRAVPPPAPVADKSQIVQRQMEICDRCGAINSFRKIAGFRPFIAFGLAYARCLHCGHKAQIRIPQN